MGSLIAGVFAAFIRLLSFKCATCGAFTMRRDKNGWLCIDCKAQASIKAMKREPSGDLRQP